MTPKLLKLKEVAALRNVGLTRLDVEIADGLMPGKVEIGRNVYLPASEVEAVMTARIAGQTNDQIRRLVRHLMLLRKERADALASKVG